MNEKLSTTVLIRHAQSAPSNKIPEPDWPLSSLGRRQATALASDLAGAGITQVVSSPYVRAVDTVQPLSSQLGLSIEIQSGLRERKLCDDVRDDWHIIIEKAWTDFNFALPGCESGFECQKRIQKCMQDVVSRYTGQTIAVCSHGNAIGLFLNTIDQNFGYLNWKQMKNPDVFWIDWRNGYPRWRLHV